MSMTSCPQCAGEMSGYASSCPHCGIENPSSPVAVLNEVPPSSEGTVDVSGPDSETILEKIAPPPPPPKKLSWFSEFQEEWRRLAPPQKIAGTILCGLALGVIIGFVCYLILILV